MKFPNMATTVAYQYFMSSNIGATHNIGQLKQHTRLLKAESKKIHPFISSCTHHIINNIDWAFIESELVDAKQEINKPDSSD
tara:strand:+ start:7715 stop:7960 length:246 start_codon:yes stop_codon:yes gene_type:complete